ncbi:hypothetical protein Wxf_03238 [Armadillidium vulgare]|nr:hypothetical protein Wxf_03238 [Armadillidium vulgare] [Wolbachia endosymbiont of Armadillidium vulgare]
MTVLNLIQIKYFFLKSGNNLLLSSNQGIFLIESYYSDVHERWDLPIELNNNTMKPEEFKERASNPGLLRYYQPNEQGRLQIYHNQPIDKNHIGLVDLKDKSILDFDMKVMDGSLVLSYKNNTFVKVENWNTYQPAREMIFAFKDAIVSNSRCIASICNLEDVIEEFNKGKAAILQLRNELVNAIAGNNLDKIKELLLRKKSKH